MKQRIINTLAKRNINDRQVLILDNPKCIKGQRVLVRANGRLVKARVISDGEWPIAVCCDDGAG